MNQIVVRDGKGKKDRITVLPEGVKRDIETRLKAFTRSLDPEYKYIAMGLRDVVNYMNGKEMPDREQLWSKFLIKNKERDQFRQESFDGVFPEFNDILRSSNSSKGSLKYRIRNRIGNLLRNLQKIGS